MRKPTPCIMYRGARYMIVAQETVQYNALYDKEGWKFSQLSSDIIEGQTLYSWEGPEDSAPLGIVAEGTMEKKVGDVVVKAKFSVDYMDSSSDDDGGESFNPENLSVTLESPKGAVVDFEGEVESLEKELPAIVSDMFHEDDVIDTLIGSSKSYYFKRRSEFGKTYKGLQKSWHTFR